MDVEKLSRTRSGSAVLQIADEWGLEPSSVAEAAREVYRRQVSEVASGERQGPYPAFYDRNILEPAAVSVAVRERYRQAAPDNPSAGWKNVGGANMYIDESGTITAGCPGVKGEEVDELDENQEEREQRQDVAESRGLEGEEVTAQQAEHLDEQPMGNVPTAEAPQTVTIKGQPFEVKKDKDVWFWRRPQTQAWTAASPEMIEVIEGATVAQAQGEFDINPNTRFGQAVLAMAKDYSLPPDDLADAAKHVIEGRQEFIRNREGAKQHARQLTGINAAMISVLENEAGLDHASAWKVASVEKPMFVGVTNANVGGRMRSFDQFAEEVAREHPELQINDESDLWNILREGVQRPPQPWDPDILREAANLATASAGYEPEGEYAEAFKRSGAVEKYRRWKNVGKLSRVYYGASSDADVERFWKGEIQDAIIIEDGQPMRYWRSGDSFSCEKYARTPGAGQASFAWNESEHPRDEEGKFAETEGQTINATDKERGKYTEYLRNMKEAGIDARSEEDWLAMYREKNPVVEEKEPEPEKLPAEPKPERKAVPKVPKFNSINDASTYSHTHLLPVSGNFNLDGLKPDKAHAIIRGMASVMTPLGVKVRAIEWNQRRARAMAVYSKPYSGGIGAIRFQKTHTKTHSEKRIQAEYDRWEGKKDQRVADSEKRLERAKEQSPNPKIHESLQTRVEYEKATDRYTVRSKDHLFDNAAHEAGHAVYYQGRIDSGKKDFGSGKPIFRSVDAIWHQELKDRNVEMVDRYAVSDYAATNNSELFAEVTVAVHTDQEHIVPDNVLAAYKAVMAKWQRDESRN